MPSRNYRDLIAWQRVMDFVAAVYECTRAFPREELYGLRSQLRRSAVSVPSNIAEGQGRGGATELLRFLRIAYGSLREAETQILIAERLGFLSSARCGPVMDLAGEVGRLLNGLMRSNE